MWHNIKHIERPATAKEAVDLYRAGEAIFFGGGTYLVGQRPEGVHTLIDINRLIPRWMERHESVCLLGAGATIQQLIDFVPPSAPLKIAQAARNSSYSKNIRNQRTLGGEIAWGRTDSDLYVLLTAVNPLIVVLAPNTKEVRLCDWDNRGIVAMIMLTKEDATPVGYNRFALIESAPPFVVTMVLRQDGGYRVVVGGKCQQLFTINTPDLSDHQIAYFAKLAVQHFTADHIGSLEYKEHVIATGIRRGRDSI